MPGEDSEGTFSIQEPVTDEARVNERSQQEGLSHETTSSMVAMVALLASVEKWAAGDLNPNNPLHERIRSCAHGGGCSAR